MNILLEIRENPFPILELAAVGDDDFFASLAALGSVRFDLLDDIHALNDIAEDDVTVVQPAGLNGSDEELGTVCVRSSVGHRQRSRSGVLQCEVLVGEFLSVDRFATSSVVVGEVSTLAHEVRNDAMECRVFVTEALLPGAQSTEVLGGFRDDVRSELQAR